MVPGAAVGGAARSAGARRSLLISLPEHSELPMIRALLLAASALAAAPAFAAPAPPHRAPAPAMSEGQKLATLFHDSDEATLRRNPIQALFRGDMRYAPEFGDYITDRYQAAEKAAAEADLAALARIDRAKLNADDRISYDVFKWQTALTLKGYRPDLLKTQIERPIDHFSGFQVFVPDLSSGEGAAPFKTVADYENNLKRLEGYIVYLDRATARMSQGLADGVVNPKLVMKNVVDQLDGIVAQGVEGSTFYKPVTHFPAGIPAAEQARLKARYAAFIRDRLNPAHARLRDFIKTDYLPHARDSVGLGQMKGGPALYGYLVEQNTTTQMSPAVIHALGLREVDRIHGEMEKVKNAVGFKGDLHQFADFLRTDPRFKPATAAAMRDAFLDIDRRVGLVVGRDFSVIPKTPLEIRPDPPYREKTSAGGEYNQGTPDGSRPGVFYYNSYD